MRIAVCSVQVPFVRGGAEMLSETLVEELIKRNHEVECVNIPFKWYPPKEIIKHGLLWRLMDITESNGTKIDLVICTKFPSYIVRHQNKVVWLFHQHRFAYDLYNTEYCDLKHFPDGEYVRNKLIDMDNISLKESKKIFTISKNVSNRLKRYNGLNSEFLYPPPADAEKFHCNDYGDFIICPSRLDRIKRQDLLIQSMKYVKSKIKCKIVGKGPMKGEYVALVKKLNLEDKVEFLDNTDRNDLIELYANALAVFFAPVDEDYGYITVESLLSRKPVITAPDSGGPLEFVENMVSGYVVPVEPREIAKKIDYLYENKDVAKKMGIEGFNCLKKMDISWDNIIRKLVR